MRGHLPLLAMRRAGCMPKSAALTTSPTLRDWTANWPEFTSHAEIEVEPSDAITRLDLRFLVGLPSVVVDGRDAARVDALFDAVVAAEPLKALAILHGARESRVTRTFSEGVVEWHD